MTASWWLVLSAGVLGVGLGLAFAYFRAPRRGRLVPEVYVQGLNHLLSDRSDEAVEAFLEALRQHPESSDILMALGRLFRRRGELERALRVHQYLLEQPGLSLSLRQEVLLEIARDYLKSGILNRAESILKELLHRDDRYVDGLLALAELYELGADWPQAVAVRRRLETLGQGGQKAVIALIYGEMAEASIARGDVTAAERYLAEARQADPDGPRTALIEGRLAFAQGAWERAAGIWATLLESGAYPVLLLVVQPFLEALKRCQDQPACRVWRAHLLERCDDTLTVFRVAQALVEVEGVDAARAYLHRALSQRKALPVLQLLLRLETPAPDLLPQMVEVIGALPMPNPQFQCAQCGYRTSEHHWRCPSCRSWGTFTGGALWT
ncbi:MAG: tetratricopeptide repeat protein [Acidithiobacillus sp.]|uniref:tetratricopeptide repeat protein n=1 Tax=Acidithiobacillus sp. TaxID=1872118 RepID=UPI0025BBA098|nr:tetratricopeptide repeat protein [Acidithiobacillus sp.]